MAGQSQKMGFAAGLLKKKKKETGSDFGVDISRCSLWTPCGRPLAPIILQVNVRPEVAADFLMRDGVEKAPRVR